MSKEGDFFFRLLHEIHKREPAGTDPTNSDHNNSSKMRKKKKKQKSLRKTSGKKSKRTSRAMSKEEERKKREAADREQYETQMTTTTTTTTTTSMMGPPTPTAGTPLPPRKYANVPNVAMEPPTQFEKVKAPVRPAVSKNHRRSSIRFKNPQKDTDIDAQSAGSMSQGTATDDYEGQNAKEREIANAIMERSVCVREKQPRSNKMETGTRARSKLRTKSKRERAQKSNERADEELDKLEDAAEGDFGFSIDDRLEKLPDDCPFTADGVSKTAPAEIEVSVEEADEKEHRPSSADRVEGDVIKVSREKASAEKVVDKEKAKPTEKLRSREKQEKSGAKREKEERSGVKQETQEKSGNKRERQERSAEKK